MIDVMLVLLIIFMIIVPTIQTSFKAIPPNGANLKPAPEEDDDQILGIDANGQYFLNRQPIHNDALGRMLDDIYSKRTKDKILFIKADKGLQYGKVLDALDVAEHNGVRKAAMVTDQAPGTISKIAADRINPSATDANSTGTGENP